MIAGYNVVSAEEMAKKKGQKVKRKRALPPEPASPTHGSSRESIAESQNIESRSIACFHVARSARPDYLATVSEGSEEADAEEHEGNNSKPEMKRYDKCLCLTLIQWHQRTQKGLDK